MFICRLIYYFKQFPSKLLFRGVQGTLFLVPMVSPECRFHSTDFPSLSYASAIVESLPRLVGENLNLDCLQLSLFALTASCFSVWCDGGPSSCSTLRSYDTENFSLVPLHLPKRRKIYQTKLLLLSNVNKDRFVMLNLTLNRKKKIRICEGGFGVTCSKQAGW